jgi:hypothetical protein
MQYRYGWDWNPRFGKPIKELTEKQARARFDEGPQLGVTALPESGDVPLYTITMSARAQDVSVSRYDEQCSTVAVHHYTVIDSRLFLEQADEWLYPEDGKTHDMNAALAYRSYSFQPDGMATLHSRVADAEAELVEEFSDVDVSDHWIDPLTWGDWDRVGLYTPKAAPGPSA